MAKYYDGSLLSQYPQFCIVKSGFCEFCLTKERSNFRSSLADPVQSGQVKLCLQLNSIPREEDRAIVEVIKSCSVFEATKSAFSK